jgi:hypothetical protein
MTPNPHTGKLSVNVRGQLFIFNGDTWSTPTAELNELLDDAQAAPRNNTDILELAEIVLRKVKMWEGARILDVVRDEWKTKTELPPDAID